MPSWFVAIRDKNGGKLGSKNDFISILENHFPKIILNIEHSPFQSRPGRDSPTRARQEWP
jgi:hypothetical protein